MVAAVGARRVAQEHVDHLAVDANPGLGEAGVEVVEQPADGPLEGQCRWRSRRPRSGSVR
jgi:hypothetical protein